MRFLFEDELPGQTDIFTLEKELNAEELYNQIKDKNDIESWFEVLVPQSGPAHTLAGELVRAMMRILYRDSNDGDRFFSGYGLETCGGSAQFLRENTDYEIATTLEDIAENNLKDSEYTKAIEDVSRRLLGYLNDNKELIGTENTDDSREWELAEDLIPVYDFDCELPPELYDIIRYTDYSEEDLENEIYYWEAYGEQIGKAAERLHVDGYMLYIDGIQEDVYNELNREMYRWLEDFAEELSKDYPLEDEEDEEDDLDESLAPGEKVPEDKKIRILKSIEDVRNSKGDLNTKINYLTKLRKDYDLDKEIVDACTDAIKLLSDEKYKLLENNTNKETVDLYYNDLTVTDYGRLVDDDWRELPYYPDEHEIDIDYTYEVDKDDIIEYLGDLAYGDDIELSVLEPNTDEFWKYIEDNFDELFEKYEQDILDYYREAASEYAQEHYDFDESLDSKIDLDEALGLKEGISKDMTAEDIAKKHKVPVSKIRAQVKKGIKVEKEHTKDEKKAERIALDHLFEIPNYYDKLAKMEKSALKESTWVCKQWPEDKADKAQLDRKLRYLNLRKELKDKDAIIKGDKENIQKFMKWLGLTDNRFSEIKEESLKEDKEPKVCAICKKEYTGYGNNAEPVAHGQCCDECNRKVVIPARLKGLKEDIDADEDWVDYKYVFESPIMITSNEDDDRDWSGSVFGEWDEDTYSIHELNKQLEDETYELLDYVIDDEIKDANLKVVQNDDGILVLRTTIETFEPIDVEETMKRLTGQFSDGWGESFEQYPFETWEDEEEDPFDRTQYHHWFHSWFNKQVNPGKEWAKKWYIKCIEESKIFESLKEDVKYGSGIFDIGTKFKIKGIEDIFEIFNIDEFGNVTFGYKGKYAGERHGDTLDNLENSHNNDKITIITEDTIKQNGKWVNKGKEGTHGTFKTKKAADAQRKAMFANGFEESLNESKDKPIKYKGYTIEYDDEKNNAYIVYNKNGSDATAGWTFKSVKEAKEAIDNDQDFAYPNSSLNESVDEDEYFEKLKPEIEEWARGDFQAGKLLDWDDMEEFEKLLLDNHPDIRHHKEMPDLIYNLFDIYWEEIDKLRENENIEEKLIQGKSDATLKKNIATEVKAGKDPKQAYAIAKSIQKKNMKEDLEIGADFYGTKIGSEEADDLLFGLQVSSGQPKYNYKDFIEMNLEPEAIQAAKELSKKYNKFTYFEDDLEIAENDLDESIQKKNMKEAFDDDDEVAVVLVIYEDENERYEYPSDYQAEAHYAELEETHVQELKSEGILGFVLFERNEDNEFVVIDRFIVDPIDEGMIETTISDFLDNNNEGELSLKGHIAKEPQPDPLDGDIDESLNEGKADIYAEIEDDYFKALAEAEDHGTVIFSVIPYGLEAVEFDTFDEAKQYAKKVGEDKIHVSAFSKCWGYYCDDEYDEYEERILDLNKNIIESLNESLSSNRLIWDDCTPTQERRPGTIDDIEYDIHVVDYRSKNKLLAKLMELAGVDEEDFEDSDTFDEKVNYCLNYLDDPGDGSPNVLYIKVEDDDNYDYFTYDELEDLDLATCTEQDVKDALTGELDDEDYEEIEEVFDDTDKEIDELKAFADKAMKEGIKPLNISKQDPDNINVLTDNVEINFDDIDDEEIVDYKNENIKENLNN